VVHEARDGTGAETFGARLRRARTAAGLSQTALAGDDLSPSYVSHLESDRREPTPAVVVRLAARLGVSPADLQPQVAVSPEHDLVLAQAAVGLGRPAEALALLAPWEARLSDVEALAGDPQLFRAAEVRAAALGRTFATADDLKALAPVTLHHRIVVRPEATVQGVTPEDVIDDLLRSVAVPATGEARS